MHESVKIRKMLYSDMENLMHLKNAEKWNQREKDWKLLIGYKDSVNLVAEIDDTVVGSITAINYEYRVAWIGMMLVAKAFRGRGISKRLLNLTIDRLHNCMSIKLDATPAGRPVYKKIGFEDEYTIYRMTNPEVIKPPQARRQYSVEKIKKTDLKLIAELDKQIFGADRMQLIFWLYADSPELAWLVKENNSIQGFCLGRKGVRFTQIGPLYGTSDEYIKAILISVLGQVEGKPVVIDLHADKKNLQEWLLNSGFSQQRPFERMYLHKNPYPGIIKKQYGICGPELG